MTNNRKTILTLAAVATLAAALAPTSASAAFGRGGSRPVLAQHAPTHAPVVSQRPAWHRPVVAHNPSVPVRHAPVVSWHSHTSRPTWHRPIEVKVVTGYGYARPRYFAPRIATYAAPVYAAPVYASTYAAAPTYAAPRPIVRPAVQAQAAVNGQNVVLVEVPNNGQFGMTAEGQWVKQQSDGKTFQFTEDKRDGSSVYITDASRGVSLQLDLSQKQVFLLGASAKRAVFPILNASAG